MVSLVSHVHELVDSLSLGLNDHFLRKWYPLVVDEECGGYLTNISYDWCPAAEQEKTIVNQARHVLTTSKATMFVPDPSRYQSYALHGLSFLSDCMWDQRYGGFFQVRSRQGTYTDCRGWGDEKRTYGNASGVHALASLYALTGDAAVLHFAQEAFQWIETHSRDSECGGYFSFLTRRGEPIDETSQYRSVASDSRGVGLKDQNSLSFLLEAYTDLYRVWKDDTLGARLSDLLTLIRDTVVTEKGYLQLYFSRDWTPLSYRSASEATRALNYGLDHISFGHDCKTALLLLAASHALGIPNDTRTLAVAKRLIDHALLYGWDPEVGGFYDAGYEFDGSDECTIIDRAKTWWGQAEALTVLLVLALIDPGTAAYRRSFDRQWEYIECYLHDRHNGDWFEGGLDQDPHLRTGPKGDMWKCPYHQAKALMTCIALLTDTDDAPPGVIMRHQEQMAFIDHWKQMTTTAAQQEDAVTHVAVRDTPLRAPTL